VYARAARVLACAWHEAVATRKHATMPPTAFGRPIGQPREYSRTRMFGAPDVFATANLSTHLRRRQPQVRRTRTPAHLLHRSTTRATHAAGAAPR